MNLNDMKGSMPDVKRGKPAKEIILLIVYNLIYSLFSYVVFNHLNLSVTAENMILGILTVISIAAIIAVGIKILPKKDAAYKGLIYLCAIAPIGVIADWMM